MGQCKGEEKENIGKRGEKEVGQGPILFVSFAIDVHMENKHDLLNMTAES